MSFLGLPRANLGAAALKKSPEVDPFPDSEAFRRWLGNSVVAQRGAKDLRKGPIRVFHGSQSVFDVFQPPEGAEGRQSWNGFGSWFTEDSAYAAKFSRRSDTPERGPVYSVYLSIQNPLSLTGDGPRGFGKLMQMYEQVTGRKTSEANKASNDKFREYLKAQGYDGVVLRNFTGDLALSPYAQNFYIILDPSQAKNVNNLGTWNPADPNMFNGLRRR